MADRSLYRRGRRPRGPALLRGRGGLAAAGDEGPRRLPDWPARLRRYIDSHSWREPGQPTQFKPFVWGELDCALFALGAIDALCGTGFCDEHRGKYQDAATALAYCTARGWKTTADAARAYLGEPLEHWAHSRDGDVLHTPSPLFPGGQLLIRHGNHAVGPGSDKLFWIDLNLIKSAAAFAVGRR